MGLGNLYDFFRDGVAPGKGLGETVYNAETLAAAADRNAAIAQLGAEGKSEAAAAAVERFASIYGAEAGNLALKSMSLGGVLVCGNIAARMLPCPAAGRLHAGLPRQGALHEGAREGAGRGGARLGRRAGGVDAGGAGESLRLTPCA